MNFQVGYKNGGITYLNRTAREITPHGALFDDHAKPGDKNRLFVLIPWHRIDDVMIALGPDELITDIFP